MRQPRLCCRAIMLLHPRSNLDEIQRMRTCAPIRRLSLVAVRQALTVMMSLGLKLLGIPVLALFSTSSCFAEVQVTVEGNLIRSVDVEALLADSLKIDQRPRAGEDADCPGGGGGPGFRAKRWCKWYRQFRDLAVERVISLQVG